MMALRVGKDPFDYINEIKIERSRQNMKRRLSEYRPNQNSIHKLERVDQKHHLIVFSADWCGDCVAYVPGLAKTLIMAKNSMLQARVVDYDNYRDLAEEFNVHAIPTIIVYDKSWKEIGRFVETPRKYGTVEEEVCAILDAASNAAKV
ncbi:MAG TPA: thioredoxin family protein [Candidatus Bathyarchaeia archaeon]|nr:thioredoxin family protein [Candidatus Bathyarchaeia archaeon]